MLYITKGRTGYGSSNQLLSYSPDGELLNNFSANISCNLIKKSLSESESRELVIYGAPVIDNDGFLYVSTKDYLYKLNPDLSTVWRLSYWDFNDDVFSYYRFCPMVVGLNGDIYLSMSNWGKHLFTMPLNYTQYLFNETGHDKIRGNLTNIISHYQMSSHSTLEICILRCICLMTIILSRR